MPAGLGYVLQYTDQSVIATVMSVPEPGTLSALGIPAVLTLVRRRHRNYSR
jgi:hypothetical protein